MPDTKPPPEQTPPPSSDWPPLEFTPGPDDQKPERDPAAVDEILARVGAIVLYTMQGGQVVPAIVIQSHGGDYDEADLFVIAPYRYGGPFCLPKPADRGEAGDVGKWAPKL